MTFEWDEEKNRLNREKHDGISFEYAVRVFLDNKRIERYDAEHSSLTEDRWNAIGMVERVLFVVYTERGENTRIISARRATKDEEDEYYDGYEFR
ncbi:MAG: BrnT family toxin [Eubacterium sp.]|nr:BrnT family toxin [Eubacterium sp.]